MRLRVSLARFLIRFGRLIQSSALMVMRPDDIIAFNRQTYTKSASLGGWNQESLVTMGLTPEETTLLEKIPQKKGKLLLLGVGGGREAIPLGRLGFEVTGVDFIPEMVAGARKNAAQCGVTLNGLVQEISTLDVPANTYDVVWLSASMYSSVPTRRRRIDMLNRIGRSLVNGGLFICQFHWNPNIESSATAACARKLMAFLTGGNLRYENGDHLWGYSEFLHAFSTRDEITKEFCAGGFDLICLHTPEGSFSGGAVLKRKPAL